MRFRVYAVIAGLMIASLWVDYGPLKVFSSIILGYFIISCMANDVGGNSK